MDKAKIVETLQLNDSTVLSFPDRGPWGDKKYRGNCSGWIPAFLCWKYRTKKMAELFSGSGTGYDVAKDMGIAYAGADLNPSAVRPGIIRTDAINDDVPDAFYGADMIFMHPPYGKEIGIPYAGSMYADPTGELSKSDLGQMPWEEFMKTLNVVVMKYFASMETGAYMGILMGDVRRKGKFHSMFTDIVKPGELQQVIIKMQHNTMSGGRSYSNRNFVPVVHEYVMVLKKMSPYLIEFQLPRGYSLDVRDSSSATWLDVVYAAMQKTSYGNRYATLEDLYREIDGHKKCAANPHWKEKIRQTLQLHKDVFLNTGRGQWILQAA